MATIAFATELPPIAPITKLETRRLPPEEVKRRVIEQLADALILQPDPIISKAPRRPLYELWFSTRAYPTHIPSLCAIDQLVVRFLPSGPLKGADTEVRASGIHQMATLYRFTSAPMSPEPDGVSAPSQLTAASQCAQLDVKDEGVFGADDEYLANEGVFFWNKLTDEIQSGVHKISLSCADTAKCSAMIGRLKPGPIDSVHYCNKPTANCIAISTRDLLEVNIIFSDNTVVSASIREEVVIADAKAD